MRTMRLYPEYFGGYGVFGNLSLSRFNLRVNLVWILAAKILITACIKFFLKCRTMLQYVSGIFHTGLLLLNVTGSKIK